MHECPAHSALRLGTGGQGRGAWGGGGGSREAAAGEGVVRRHKGTRAGSRETGKF